MFGFRSQTMVTAALMLLLGLTAAAPAFAQVTLPGSPQQAPNPNPLNIFFGEAAEGQEGPFVQTVGVPINNGFLVMTEDNTSNAASNWSDVIRFHNITANNGLVVGEIIMVSDGDPTGFTDANLAGLGIPGLTVATVANATNTQFLPEVNLPNGMGNGVQYAAIGANGNTINYTFISDSPEPSALAFAGSGALPLLCLMYRRARRRR